MPNFTLDDSDPTLAFAPGQWATQLPSDPDLDLFFDRTYHAAQADGASVSFQFSGFAFALYGSRGPGHGKFQVQFDDTVVTLDAFAPTTAFHQELFAHAFGNASASSPSSSNSSDGGSGSGMGTHLVKVTAVLSGDGVRGRWFDLDYVTFASAPESASTSSIGTVTSLPPWLSGSGFSQTNAPSPSSSLTPFRSTSNPAPAPSKTPTILAATFGALIALALLLGGLYLFLRRAYDKRRARERAFRYGQSSVFAGASSVASGSVLGGGGGGTGGGTGTGGAFSPTPSSKVLKDLPLPAGVPRDAPLHSHSHTHTHAPSQSLSSSQTEMRMASSSPLGTYSASPVGGLGLGGGPTREDAPTPTGGGGSSVTRPLLSGSPIAWGRSRGRGRGGGRDKGDADSLRTDFLQV
ncbi:hypothetical protein OH77DRAFT_1437169 [Trametes cingulata]|nr:hypothetical protein OH77DRAFT_1437169 [Trametes cingulata]